MAQVDTGLGWEAKGEYLKEPSGAIATAGGMQTDLTGFENQPIPDATFPDTTEALDALTIARGLMIGDSPSGDRMYLLANTPDCYVIKQEGTYGRGYTYISPVSGAGVHLILVLANGRVWQRSSPVITTPETTTSGDTVYYARPTFNYQVQNFYIKEYANDTEMMNIIHSFYKSDVTFTKVNTGYAVACICTWYTPDGTEHTSPILISTVEEYVEMSGTGFTPYTNIRLYEGLRFFMSMYLDLPPIQNVGLTVVDLRQFGAAAPSKVFALLADESFANIRVPNSPDPYEQEGEASEEDGGDGEEIQDDEIDFTPAPTSMAVASGFITLFCPSQAELNALADYMWSPLFDVDTLKKLFANPMDCILGLSVIPVPIVPEGTKTVKVGGVSTTVSMGYTNHQYYPVDCGTVTIPKRWGAYMDYAPYTKLNIFLPYIGFRQISADDVMGKTLHLRYMIDILSGACNAELKVNNAVLYSWAGSCAMQIPITGNDWRSAITAGVSIAGSVAATVLSGGASAPMIAGTVASATVNSLALKPEVQRSGSLSSASGFLAAQRPYIVRTNPRNAIPANQNKYSGYPSFVTVSLGSLTGYNEVYSVHLENIPATGAELDEIETILKGGAIF